MGKAVVAWVAAAVVAVAACSEESPSGPDDSQLPTEPVTVSLQIPWDEFGSDLQVFGGYGRVDDVESLVVARGYDGMEARTLLRFAAIPESATVRTTNGLRTDTALTYIQAYIVMSIDTAASTTTGVMELAFSHTTEWWDSRTTNWGNAIDTLGGPVPWSAPGGGAVTPLATREYDPSSSDSTQFFLDADAILQWREGNDSVRSGRVDLLTDGNRLKVRDVAMRVLALSEIQEDTTLVFTIPVTAATFIYDPPVTPPADGMRVGGAPAWRTAMDITLPTTLDGPPVLCAAVGCPFALGPEHVTSASLRLRTMLSPTAFQPTDTMAMEVRAVLDKPSLPKSPLGSPLGGLGGTQIPPSVLGVEGSEVELPITRFVQSYLAGPDPAGREPPRTITILTTPEPNTLSFASFFGPGVNAPVLTLNLTVSPPMEIR